jgi:hypothetical protein
MTLAVRAGSRDPRKPEPEDREDDDQQAGQQSTQAAGAENDSGNQIEVESNAYHEWYHCTKE